MSRKMKDSGIEWIGEIPEGWEITKIKRKAQIYTGNSIKDSEKENYLNYENSRPYIPTKAINVNDSTIDYNNGLYIPIDDVNFKIAKKESTLLCIEGGSAGKKIAYLNQDVCFVNKLCCFESINFNSRYLYYYIKSPAFSNEFYLHISGLISGVSLGEIKEFSITIPSISEQQKIADFLDKKVSEIDKIIENTKESIEEYKKYKQAIITETVTKGLNSDVEMKDSGIEWTGEIPKDWKCIKLKYLLEKPMQYGANESGIPFEEDLPRYVRITDINTNNKLKNDEKLSLSKESAKDFILQDNDLLFARSGATVGKTFLYKKEYGICAFAGYLIRAKVNEKVLPQYVYYYTLTNSYDSWKNNIFIQSTIQNIGAEKYSNMKIAIPDTIEEQIDIVNFLDEKCLKIDTLIEKKERFIKELETYKHSIIYEYITGKKEV